MLRVGLVGFGYWGENLARNISRSEEAKLVGLTEPSTTRCERFQKFYSNVRIQQYDELLKNCEAVVIATPPATHYHLALSALFAGKHVFVEKPMCLTSADCRDLVKEADKRKLTLAVDHTFVHTPAVQKIKELFEHGEIGSRLLYYDSARVNLGAFQSDCDVVWDLAVHDLAILDYLVEFHGFGWEISAKTFSHYPSQRADQAFINLKLETSLPFGFNAHLNVSWSSPVKLRNVLLAGTEKMVVYDDIEPDEKVKVYDKRIETQADRVNYRTGDIFIPKLDNSKEGLFLSLDNFFTCIRTGEQPLSDGYSGLRVVYLLETISRSAANGGETLKIRL